MTQPPSSSGRDPRQPFTRPSGPTHPGTAPQWAGPSALHPPPGVPAGSGGAPLGPGGRPRRPRWWIALIAVLLLALLGWAAVRLSQDPTPPAVDASPSSEPSVVATPAPPSATGVRTQVPFENGTDDSSGSFEIIDHAWSAQGLLITVRVHLDRGSQRIGFFALDNNLATEYTPLAGGANYLQGQQISAGQTLTGTVLFDKPRGDTTVFLTDSTGRQVTALVVKA